MRLKLALPIIFILSLLLTLFSYTLVSAQGDAPAANDPFKCEDGTDTGSTDTGTGDTTTGISKPQPGIGQTVQPYQQSICQYKNALDEEDVNLQKFNLGLMDNLAFGINRQITGLPATDEELECIQNGGSDCAGGGAITFLMNNVALLYTQEPASGVQYLAELKSKVTGETLAAQTGYVALKPTQALWTTFRNLTLLLYVIFFIVIGFMIIFRQRLNSSTVASVQAVLPKIIVSLILVTFSYAIAGLMIDLMNFFIALMIQILSTQDVARANSNDIYYRENVFSFMLKRLFLHNISGIFSSTDEIIGGAIKNFNLPDLIEKFSSTILSALAVAVIGIMMLIATFRIFFMLLIAYVKVFFYTIFGPLMIGIGVIPGMPGFGPWIRNIAAQLSTFVITILMIIFASYFMGVDGSTEKDKSDSITSGSAVINNTEGWNAPFLGGFAGGGNNNALKALIGIGILLGIPSAAKISQDAFKVKGGGPGGMIGAAAMGAAGAGFGVARSPFNGAASRAKTRVTDFAGEKVNNTVNPWSAQRRYDRLSRQAGASTPINPGTPGPAGQTTAPGQNQRNANPFRRRP